MMTADCFGGPLDGSRVVVDENTRPAFPYGGGWYYGNIWLGRFYWRDGFYIPAVDDAKAARVQIIREEP